MFEDQGQSVITDQVSTINSFLALLKRRMLYPLEKPCTREEIHEVLKGFAKDKSPGPDGGR
jgi:hypothetical protein